MTTWLTAARSSVTFAMPALTGRTYGTGLYNVGLWPGLTGTIIMTMGAAARSTVAFAMQAPVSRQMALAASTSISFGMTAGMSWTWHHWAPCETGTWALTTLPTGPANDQLELVGT